MQFDFRQKHDWFHQSYNELENSLEPNSYAQGIIHAFLPLFERDFLIQESNKQSFKNKFKWILEAMCFQYDIKLDLAGIEFKFIAWPTQFIHLDYLIPLYFELKKRSILLHFICERDDLYKTLYDKGVSVSQFKVERKFRGISPLSFTRFKSLRTILLKSKKFQYSDMHFSNWVMQNLNYFFIYEIYSKLALSLIRQKSIKLVFVGYDLSMVVRGFLLTMKKNSVPTSMIQQGALNFFSTKYSLIDNMFVWDQISANQYLKRENNLTKTFVTGPLNFNHCIGNISNDLLEIKLACKERNQKVFLVAFSGPGHTVSEETHKKNLGIIFDFAISNVKNFFLFKLHPKDNLIYYNRLSDLKNVVIHKKSEQHTSDFQDYLSIAECVITAGSTTAINAWQVGLPVITLDLNQDLGYIDFVVSEKNYYCVDKSEFENAIYSISIMDNEYNQKMALIHEYSSEYKILSQSNPLSMVTSFIENLDKKQYENLWNMFN